MNKQSNPYVGPRPFQTGETLYGRDREARELVDLLIAERIVLLYSPSGAGKTSLVQASVIPVMKHEDYQILPVVRPGLIESTASIASGGNPFVSCLIKGCEEGKPKSEKPLLNVSGITVASYLTQRTWIQEDPRLKLLVLDQFEEVLNYDAAEEIKLAFFQQLGDALKNKQIWALFAMREEYSAALDGYRHLLPTRLSTRFRLDLLTRSNAEEAIRTPAGNSGVEFHDAAVNCLFDDLSTIRERTSDGSEMTRQSGFIEPLYLQIVCQRLWEQLPADTNQITLEHLGHMSSPEGGEPRASEVEKALESYYDRTISEISDKTHIAQRVIREWFERELLTPHGLRRQVPKGEAETAGLPNDVVEEIAKQSLVRRDSRAGTRWYEITHDRLAGVILSDNANWFSRNLESFQMNAAKWDRLRRAGAEQASESEILQGSNLSQALKWEKQHPPESLTEVDRRYLRYCENIWGFGKLKRNAKWGFIWVIIPSLLVAGWTMAYWKSQRAETEKKLTKEVEKHNEALKILGIKQQAQFLLSAAASNKWRNYNHELASLLSLHANLLIKRSGSQPALVVWGEDMLRTCLQSQPFAFSEKLDVGSGELEPALSRSLTVATFEKNAKGLNITPRIASFDRPQQKTIETEPLLGADFSPEGNDLIAITASGASLYPISADGGNPIMIKTDATPTGAYCIAPDETLLAIATCSMETGLRAIELWHLSQDKRYAERSMIITNEQLHVPKGAAICSLACGARDSWIAWGSQTGDVGYINLSHAEPVLVRIAGNNFGEWPEILKKDLNFRKHTLDYGVAALRYLEKHRWLFVLYRQGPPRIFDMDESVDLPPSAYLMPDEQSQVILRVEQEQGRAVRQVANITRLLRIDVRPDENRVVIGGGSGLVGEWNLETLSVKPEYKKDKQNSLRRIAGDIKTLYASYREYAGMQSTVMALRYITQDIGKEFTKSRQTQPLLAAVDAGLEMRLWSNQGITDAGYFSYMHSGSGIVYALDFLDSEGKRLAFGGSKSSGVLLISDTDDAITYDLSVSLPNGVRAFAVDRNFTRLAISTGYQKAGMPRPQTSWDMELGAGTAGRYEPLPHCLHTDGNWAAAMDPTGKTLLTAGWDRRAIIWKRRDQAKGNEVWEDPVELNEVPGKDPGHKSPVLSAAINPATSDIVTGTKDGCVYLWRESHNGGWSKESLLDIEIEIRALAFSPAGDRLVAGDDNGFLWIWNIDNGKYSQVAPVSAHQGAVFAIRFINNESYNLATGGSDGMVYLWKGHPGDRQRMRLAGPMGEVMSIAVSASGKLLAAGDTTGTIHFWELGLEKLLQEACSKMRRNLSMSEWKIYFGEDKYECTCSNLPPCESKKK